MTATSELWEEKNRMQNDMYNHFQANLEFWKVQHLGFPEHKTFMQELCEKSPIHIDEYRYRYPFFENKVVLKKDIKPDNFGRFDELSVELLKFKTERLESGLDFNYRDVLGLQLKRKFEVLKQAGIPVFLHNDPFGDYPDKRTGYEYSIPKQFEYQQFFITEPWHIAMRESYEHASNKLYEFIENYEY